MDKQLIDPKYAEVAGQLAELGVQYIVNIASALAVLVVGMIFAGLLQRWTQRALERVRGLDSTLRLFLSRVVKYVVLILVLVTVLAQFGVETTSMIAALGAAGLAIGLALQGTLANIAAGMMMLILRPFSVGDYIDAEGVEGTIEEIGLFTCTLCTANGIFVSAPNNKIWNSVITNYSRNGTRRFELLVGIGYGDDIEKALKTLLDLAQADDRVVADPLPVAMVKSLDDSAVSVALRVWTRTDDYWALSWDLTKRAKESFDSADISIPFPQRDVHLYEMKPS